MKWATRREIHIDRAASAWLISTFIDVDATFVYVDDLAQVPPDATTFDMVGGELSHRGQDVTFETILKTYDLLDPVLWKLARIVHEADVEDDLYDAPEAPGLDLIVRALHAHHDDESVRVLAATIFDGLYSHLRSHTLKAR